MSLDHSGMEAGETMGIFQITHILTGMLEKTVLKRGRFFQMTP